METHIASMDLQEKKNSEIIRNTGFVNCVLEHLLVNYLISLSLIFLNFKMG